MKNFSLLLCCFMCFLIIGSANTYAQQGKHKPKSKTEKDFSDEVRAEAEELIKICGGINSFDEEDRFCPTPLHKAIVYNTPEVVELLIIKGSNINAANKSFGDTPLHTATRDGKEKIISLLIEKGADINAANIMFGDTPLHEAINIRNKQIVSLLIEKGADINKRNKSGATPLFLASGASADIAFLLIKKGADIKIKNKRGEQAIFRAVQGGNKELVELMLSRGIDPKARDKDGFTLLHVASISSKALVELLISKGLDVNAKANFLGLSPIDCAKQANKKDIVELLEKKGSHSNLTPAEIKSVAERLIAKCGGINNKDDHRLTPLYYTVTWNKKEIVKYLLSRGADLNLKIGHYQYTLLHSVTSKEMAEFLVSKGANLNVKDKSGSTPLHTASLHVNKKLVEFFLSKGADINALDNNGGSPLHSVAVSREVTRRNISKKKIKELIEFLISKNAKLNLQEKRNGYTPLHYAIYLNNLDIAQLLLKGGADPNIMDNSDATPLDHAQTNEAKTMLLKFGAKSGRDKQNK